MLNILDALHFCQNTATIWQFIGWILFVFKVVVPILLILFGMIDLGKAVVSNDEKAIKSATSSLIKRAIAAVVLFFLPTLVSAIFTIVAQFTGAVETQYKICKNCVVNPGKCDTSADLGKDYVTD